MTAASAASAASPTIGNTGSIGSIPSKGGGAAETAETAGTRETREAQRRRQWATAGASMAQRSSAELARQRQGPGSKVGDDQRWRTTQINNDYGLCATYPQLLSVPAGASDDLLSRAAKYRSKCRIPALVWRHPTLKSECDPIILSLYPFITLYTPVIHHLYTIYTPA